jgi:hypothetical protein
LREKNGGTRGQLLQGEKEIGGRDTKCGMSPAPGARRAGAKAKAMVDDG